MREAEFNVLINELKSGNNQSLQIIFEEHAEFCVQNLLRQTTCSLAEAEDIFMDAVLNFREKAIKGKITYMTRIRNYIYTTCLNMYRVNYAKQQRAREKTEEVLMYFQDDTVVEETDQEGEDERQQVVIRAFKKLDEKCRCILKSYYVHHHKMSEIAKELGFTNANVAKTAKSRCYKKWIKEIKKMNESYIDITSSK